MLTTIGAGAAAGVLAPRALFAAQNPAFGDEAFVAAIAAAERVGQGRLGVAVLDLATGARFARRGDERFPMCSTFKFPLSAAVLDAAHRGRLRLDRRVAIRRGDIIANSAVTRAHVGGTLSVDQLCHATMTTSDNAAANLLLPLIGGVDGFNAFLRRIGDDTTRLDRVEPHLNEGRAGDPRDTTTPAGDDADDARVAVRHRAAGSRTRQLIGWLVANTTGGARLRAGLPAAGGWATRPGRARPARTTSR